jgi:hypothetical protein
MAFLEVLRKDLQIGESYKLFDYERVLGDSAMGVTRLWRFPRRLLSMEKLENDNRYKLQFEKEDITNIDLLPEDLIITVPENQKFLKRQKSVSNVYRNKSKEFITRNAFEKRGMTGYNPGANLIVKTGLQLKYTPNPYQPRKSRKNRKYRKNRKTMYRRRK